MREHARMTRGQLTLYVVPASHPCAAVELALKRKGLAYRRVDLPPVLHALHQAVVFGRRTVPGLRLGTGEKVVGSRAIMRVLDGLEPAPPLLPADAARRARVEAAEAWADEILQPLVRRLVYGGFRRAPQAMLSYGEGADLPVPPAVAARTAPLIIPLGRALNRASDRAVRDDVAALAGRLDRADGYVAEGTIGGEPVNVADLQIGASLRLLMTMDDFRPDLEQRPSGRLALRLFPDYPGRMPSGSVPAATARS
jgi:glutathione S-transferase